jgi:branched-chain amino acid transport system substrate-binding protein
MHTRSWSFRRYVQVGLGVSVAALGISIAGGGAGAAPRPAGKPPIYFGAVMSLTGALSGYDVPALQGLQAEVATLDENGGLLGRKVVFVYENDASDPTKVVPALQALTSAHKLSFLLPELIPPFQSEMLPYTKALKIVTASSTDGPGLFDASMNPYNYQTYPANGVVQAEVAAAFKLHTGSALKMAIINDGDSAEVQFTTQVTSLVTAGHGSVVYTTTVDPTATDISLQVGQAQAAGANLLLLQSGPPTCIAGAKGVGTVGWKVPVLVGASCMNAANQTSVPASVQPYYYALGQRAYLRDAKTNGPPPTWSKFLKALKKYGAIQDLAVSRDSADTEAIVAWAIKTAGTTNTASVVKVLNKTYKTKLPAGVELTLPNPPWTATDHTFNKANLSSFWALLRPGAPVNGTYKGVTFKP